MAKRSRDVRKEVNFTEEEWKMVVINMEKLGTMNFNAFARKMSIDGYVIRTDYSDIRTMNGELGKIGSNINQIAKRANESRAVYQTDVDEVLRELHKIQILINDKVGKLIKMKG